MVFGSGEAPSKRSKFAEKVDMTVPSSEKAAEPSDSIEFGPGIGPSDSISVLTNISDLEDVIDVISKFRFC